MFDMGLEMAAQYACTHSMYDALPHKFAVFLLDDPSEREAAMEQLRSLVLATLKAFDMIENGAGTAALNEAYVDLGWPETEVGKLMVALLLQSDFNKDDLKSISLAQKLFCASSTTKDVLEAVFAHLRDAANKANTNMMLSPTSKWYYATTASSPETGGHKRLLPSRQTISRYLHRPNRMRNFNEKMLFDMRTTLLPMSGKFDINANSVAKHKWRPAGPLSCQRASAAGHLLIQQADADFRQLPSAWAGWKMTISKRKKSCFYPFSATSLRLSFRVLAVQVVCSQRGSSTRKKHIGVLHDFGRVEKLQVGCMGFACCFVQNRG